MSYQVIQKSVKLSFYNNHPNYKLELENELVQFDKPKAFSYVTGLPISVLSMILTAISDKPS